MMKHEVLTLKVWKGSCWIPWGICPQLYTYAMNVFSSIKLGKVGRSPGSLNEGRKLLGVAPQLLDGCSTVLDGCSMAARRVLDGGCSTVARPLLGNCLLGLVVYLVKNET